MKVKKESLWLLLAIASIPFAFVYRETVTAKDGVIYLYKTTWWCRKTMVKSLNSSCVGEVRRESLMTGMGHHSVCVYDNKGRLFCELFNQGFDRCGRICREAEALEYAIKTGGVYSVTACNKSSFWVAILVWISPFCWLYTRSRRLEREKLELIDSQTTTKDVKVEFHPPSIIRLKSRKRINRLKTGHGSIFSQRSGVKKHRCATEIRGDSPLT